jgi:ABC-type multidrug transport system fused ATPase/permease subunit
VKRAARLANIDRFVDATPGGYEFVVGENGSLLSGGQRQRIGIARALYHDADVIVLDEATSALDTITEREIISTLTELRASKTIIMIAHRLATLKCADQIIFLTDGRLVDVGTYDELMTRSADFRALVAASTQEH